MGRRRIDRQTQEFRASRDLVVYFVTRSDNIQVSLQLVVTHSQRVYLPCLKIPP